MLERVGSRTQRGLLKHDFVDSDAGFIGYCQDKASIRFVIQELVDAAWSVVRDDMGPLADFFLDLLLTSFSLSV